MRTDREMLELSAKAAGYKVKQIYRGKPLSIFYNNAGDTVFWNPLANDGDALRLAVKLNVHLKQVAAPDGKKVVSAGYVVNEIRMDYIHENSDDLYAATRRAIVRAAAEIGAQM